jgi:basic amino acid/polyamine antiporter, APA family
LEPESKPTLRRFLNLPMITLYGLGTTIGGGIYVLTGLVAGRAGYYAPFSFIVAAFMITLTALSFAELASRFPKSAGEAVFVQEGFNRRSLAILVGYLVVFNGIVSSAALTEGFVGYFQTLLLLPDWMATIGIILVIGALACWGIGQSVTIAAIVTVIEIGGLALIIWVGKDALSTVPSMLPTLTPSFTAPVWAGIFAGSFLAFYAFIGFEDMVNVAEEVKDPKRNLPLAIILTLVITIILYFLTSLVSILVVPPDELAVSKAPLVHVYEVAAGNSGELISLISIIALLNGALIQIIMASRVLYGMATQGWGFRVFSQIHPVSRTPINATLAAVALTIFLALMFNIEILAETTSMIMLLIAMMVNLALFRIKLNKPAPVDALNLPAWVPLTGFIVSLVFSIFVAQDLFKNIGGLV